MAYRRRGRRSFGRRRRSFGRKRRVIRGWRAGRRF